MTFKPNFIVKICCFLFFTVGVVHDVSANEPGDTIKLQLKWLHQFQFAGYYAAQAQGFYTDEGLDVEILEGGGNKPPIDVVESGGAHFGISDSDVVLLHINGNPLVVCAALFQRSPYIILSLAERNIRQPLDLVGATVMMSGNQGQDQLQLMLAGEGIDPDLVNIIPHSWDLSDLIDGKVDAISAYTSADPSQLISMGIEPAIMHSTDFGVDFYGDTLFTTSEFAASNPERTAAIAIVLVVVLILFWNLQIHRRVQKKTHELDEAHEVLQQYAHIFASTMDMQVLIDLKFTFLAANQAILKSLNKSSSEVVGRSMTDILGNDIFNSVVYPHLRRVLKGTSVRNQDWFNIKGFEPRYMDVTYSPYRDTQHEIKGYVITARDITQMQQATEELRAHRTHLEEMVEERTLQLAEASNRAEIANEAKSSFLANMSHEIRTPLNAILGFTHLLKTSAPKPEQALQLSKIDNSAAHLLSVINDVLDLSKIEAKKLTLEETDFQLESIFDHVHAIVNEEASSKNLSVEMDTGDVPTWLKGDPTRIRQALVNYAGNAVKFTEEGSVVLRARLMEEKDNELLLRFEVQDTGIGIKQEKLNDLFNVFEQADTSTTRNFGGTGLGLSITRRIAELMGGEAGAESEFGADSLFWFTAQLNRGQGAESSPLPFIEEDAEAMLRAQYVGSHILLVEDNELNCEVAKSLLTRVGLTVEFAENGRHAVESVSSTAFDLVLMDVQMPEMDGLEATRLIRGMDKFSTLPILAMTANAFHEDREEGLSAGMNDFVAKPVNPNDLYSLLHKWLEKPVNESLL